MGSRFRVIPVAFAAILGLLPADAFSDGPFPYNGCFLTSGDGERKEGKITGSRWTTNELEVIGCYTAEFLPPCVQWSVKNKTSDKLRVNLKKKYTLGSGRKIEVGGCEFDLAPNQKKKGDKFLGDEFCLFEAFFKDEYPNREWEIRSFGFEQKTTNLSKVEREKEVEAAEASRRAREQERVRKAEQERAAREYQAAESRRAQLEAKQRRHEGIRKLVHDSGVEASERAERYSRGAAEIDGRIASQEAESRRRRSEVREARRQSEDALSAVHDSNVAEHEEQVAQADARLNARLQEEAERARRDREYRQSLQYPEPDVPSGGNSIQGSSINLCRQRTTVCKLQKRTGPVTVKSAIQRNTDGTWCLGWQLKNTLGRQVRFSAHTIVELETGELHTDDQFGQFDVLLEPRQEVLSDCENGPFRAVYESKPGSVGLTDVLVK